MFGFSFYKLSALTLVSVIFGGLIASCAVSEVSDAPVPADYAVMAVDPPPSGPPVSLCVALDVTGSYDQSRRLAAQRLLAGHLAESFSEGQGEMIVYVHLITSWSYPEENTVAVLKLPAIPHPPVEPGLLEPQPTKEAPIFGGPAATEAAATAEAGAQAVATANATAQAGYAEALDEHTQFVTEQRQILDGFLTEFESIDPEQDWISSDIWGAIARCGERLATHDGQATIMAFSDLVEVERQGRYPDLRLDGVRVIALSHECEDPALCDELRGYWVQELTAIGATAVEFYDAAVARTLTTEAIIGPTR